MAALRTAASSSFRSAARVSSVSSVSGSSGNVAAGSAASRRVGAGASSFKPSPSASRNFSTSRIAREQKGPVDGSPPPTADSSTRTNRTALFGGITIAALAAAGFLYLGRDTKKSALNVGPEGLNKTTGSKARAQGTALSTGNKAGAGAGGLGTQGDYQKVYNAIAERLEKDPSYDDGSYGPVLVRLAWHSSGTYDKESKTGGSNGATMRFAPESDHGANAGLLAARKFLDPIKEQFPWVTYSDLWTLGGVVAVQEMGGPKIPWRPGRSDREQEHCAPDGRLPDGDKGSDHLRHIFYRMGFNDQEIVALSGAHAVGRCHADRSGFDGPWQHSPTSFNNEYFNLLLKEKWGFKKWDGPKQYEDKSTGSLMMLPTDMALVQDGSFKKWVQKYAENEDMFFDHFSKAFCTLLELGVPDENFKSFEPVNEGGRQYHLKTTAEQENSSS